MDETIKVNHKYIYQISEPWGYTHPKYGTDIPGLVLDVNEEWILFKCEDVLEYDSVKGHILILSARHYGDKANSMNSHHNATILQIKNGVGIETKFAFIGRLKEC